MSTSSSQKGAALFGALVVGGFLASLWALFQWGELLVARAGGTPFCSISATFDCSAVWDSSLAKAVHTATMVPVAGWGLMWGIVAFLLPLIALVDDKRVAAGVGTAIRVTAVAGVASVLVLGGASAIAGHLCIGCLGTYALVILWAVAAFQATKATGFQQLQKGLFWAGGATIASYLALLGPGMMTPHALDSGKDAIAKAAVHEGDAGPSTTPTPAVDDSNKGPGPFDGPPLTDPAKNAALNEMVKQLDGQSKQVFASFLGDFDNTKPAAFVPPPRVVVGDPKAAVHLVDWTDPMCPHCAELHETIDEIKKAAGPDAIAVEPHFFPLDATCNPQVQRKDETMGAIRCTATKALLCLEGEPDRFALAQKLIFENQAQLTGADKVWDVLKPIADKSKLEPCMNSAETEKKLAADIDSATKNHLEGTPLVLLNGKEVKPMGPLLYALTLTGGKTHVEPFRSLPAAKPLPQHP